MTTDQEKMIVVTVDPELEDIIPLFMENVRKDMEAIAAALVQSDADTVRRIGHSMKSYGAGYGFEFISIQGKAIETAAGRLEPAAVQELLNELANYLDHVKVICG